MKPEEQPAEWPAVPGWELKQDTEPDPALQAWLAHLDGTLRGQFSMQAEHTAAGILDLKRHRLAMVRPDAMMYAASLAKVAILLGFFHKHPDTLRLSVETRHELGLMIKQSSNEMATKFSRELGLAAIQSILNSYGFYDASGPGGLWMGKHYGDDSERIGDPLHDHSHGVNVRQLLRFYWLLDQGKLVSSEASALMLEIFASPGIPHDRIKFVKGLEGREAELLRKWGSWENWLHDSAIVQGEGRRYILVGLTNHPKGDDYLAALARATDEALAN